MFQINAVTWLGRLRESGVSATSLAEIPEHELDLLARRGVDAVWLMGVWTKGAVGLALARDNPAVAPQYERALPGWQMRDVVGSPFAVRAYEVARELGGNDALRALRERLAERGVALVLDFIPNHTARDHAWVHERPDFYVSGDFALAKSRSTRYFAAETRHGPRAIAYGKDPHFEGWIDTAQLDWWNPELRAAMREVLVTIAGQCDGVRCDMAMLPLNGVFGGTWHELAEAGRGAPREEAWPALLDAARRVNPSFVALAEVYWGLEGRLLELGFDYTYDKQLYDALRAGDSSRIRASFAQPLTYLRRSMHFIENHDEDPAVSAFPPNRLMMAATLTATLPGLRFFHEGQLDGRTVRLPVQLGRPAAAALPADLAAFYERLFALLHEPLLRDGEFIRLIARRDAGEGREHHGVVAENVLAHAWLGRWCDPIVVVVANVHDAPASVRVELNLLPIGGREVAIADALAPGALGRTIARDASRGYGSDLAFPSDRVIASGDDLLARGLAISLPGWGSRVVLVRSSE